MGFVGEGLDKAVVVLADHSIVPYLEFSIFSHADVVAVEVTMEELVVLPLAEEFSQTAQNVP